ncbi:sulfatase [Wenyingzhuangia aestuarii]|uniref:sulfatase n=1 Tax=Wenyingzhuangia aestuarii TaxID=1647582 RepID=UPI00143921D0|nr:sulfatase [Wenyingzhuangia aestuarii]NJB82083.1 arylsulfatase A-like enzyme [Wenyingzhuangia aestuarii]
MKNTILLFAIVFTFLFNSCKSNSSSKDNRPKPNVVFFLVDDMGWTDASVFGSDLYQTPNIDQLVSDGMSFTNAYASCTVCSPTRASIMTGKYPARLYVTDWIEGHEKPYAKLKIPEWNQKLDLDEVTLAEMFQKNGYKTVHLGKWHLGEDAKYWPENQGFDKNIAGFSAGSPKADGGKGYFSPYNNPRLSDGEKGEYLTDRLAKEAVAYIQKHKKEPFFMNLWLYNVHMPLQAKKEVVQKYKALVKKGMTHQNATYAAMIEHMDTALGTVVKALKENGLEENTILVFHSDNGGHLLPTKNTPLKSGKGDVYEGGVRVPLIFKWPNKIKAGVVTETVAISADVFPSLMGLTNSFVKSPRNIDGVDLSPLLLNKGVVKRDAVYWHYPHYHPGGAKPYSAIRKGDWKLIQVFEHDTLELYNLKTDIGETTNLATKYPEKTEELVKDLETWRKSVNAQMPTVNKDYNPEKNFFKKKRKKH